MSFSQIENGEVDYALYFNYTNEDIPNENFKKVYENLNTISGNIHFKLNFNAVESSFVNIEDIESNSSKYKIALGFSKYNSIIYNNLKDEMFYVNNNTLFMFFAPKQFVITKKYLTNWTLTNESKLIDGKLCYKATTTDYSFIKDKKKVFEVIAWYCPEIPIKFGPLFYNNLPGLIFEVQYDKISLIIKNIKLNSNNFIKFQKPTGESTVTYDEFYVKLNEKVNELQEEVNKG